MNKEIQKNTYDEVTYTNYPCTQSHPEHLRTLGTLFGMTPLALENARILELGCAEGNNIIPHAINYPKAQFIGVDLSKVQIEAGIKHIKELGLTNIELKHCSIMDVDNSFGKFDYIIVHGVISWVPQEVRDKIFMIANNNLTENGIAYISYNTLPGWNMIKTIRDMMLHHTSGFSNPQDKITQARLLLDFVKESVENQDTPYAKLIKSEADLLSRQDDQYLRHDHLEEDNKQYYFHEFIAEANKHNLQYLSDALLSSMYLGNMPKNVVEKLQELKDIIRTEQYMDFITNRRFRSTLLCHSNIRLNRNLNNEDIKKFSMSLNITPEILLQNTDLKNNEVIKFYYGGDKNNYLSTSSPELKAILYSFAQYPFNSFSFNELVNRAGEKLAKGGKVTDNIKTVIERELLNNAMNLVIKGYISLSITPTNNSKLKLDKPKLSRLAAYQLAHTPNNAANCWVTNHVHVPIRINLVDKLALGYMDGKTNQEEIAEKLLGEVKKGTITLNKDNKKLEDDQEIRQELAAYVTNAIERFSTQAIFV